MSKISEDHQEFIDEVDNILLAMVDIDTKKVKSTSYTIKDVSQTWCKMWQDNWDLGGVPVARELLRYQFLKRFFPREMREDKIEEYINLKQGYITVSEYSLKFVKLSR